MELTEIKTIMNKVTPQKMLRLAIDAPLAPIVVGQAVPLSKTYFRTNTLLEQMMNQIYLREAEQTAKSAVEFVLSE